MGKTGHCKGKDNIFFYGKDTKFTNWEQDFLYTIE